MKLSAVIIRSNEFRTNKICACSIRYTNNYN